jgi:hypothetical protein
MPTLLTSGFTCRFRIRNPEINESWSEILRLSTAIPCPMFQTKNGGHSPDMEPKGELQGSIGKVQIFITGIT